MQAKTQCPVELVTGSGLGVSYSSLGQIGSIAPSTKPGEAKLACFANITTGNLVVFDRAVRVEERNFPLALQFIYNSEVKPENAWRLSLKQFKGPFDFSDLNKPLIIVAEDGHETPFHFAADFEQLTWTSPLWGQRGQSFLQFEEALQEWVLFHPDTQITEYFDKEGRLVSKTDALQRETRYIYRVDKPFELYAIEGPSGILYRLEKISSAEGGSELAFLALIPGKASLLPLQKWTFDNQGSLVKTIIFAEEDSASSYWINYHYNAEKMLSGIEQQDQSVTGFGYAGKKLASVSHGDTLEWQFGFDKQKNAFTVQGKEGLADLFEVDEENQLLSLSCHADLTNPDALPLTKHIHYENNQATTLIHFNGAMESFSYHKPSGKVLTHQHSQGSSLENSYEEVSPFRLLATAELNGPTKAATHFVYEDNILCEAQKKGRKGSLLRFKISPEGRVHEFRYDKKGELESSRRWFECCWLPADSMTYSNLLAWVCIQNPDAVHLTDYKSNAQGQETAITTWTRINSKGEGEPTEESGLVLKKHSLSGSLIESRTRIQENWIAIETQSLDALSRPLLQTSPLQETTTYEYENVLPDKQAQYLKICPNGRQETVVKNSRSMVVESTLKADDILRKTTFERGKESDFVLKKTLPNGLVTFHFYDKFERLCATLKPGGIVSEIKEETAKKWRMLIAYASPLDDRASTATLALLQKAIKEAGLGENKDNRISYEFLDDQGQVRYKVNAETALQEIRYDANGDITATIDYETPLSLYELEDLKKGLPLSRIINPKIDRCNRRFYDKDGLLSAEQDAAGFIKTCKRNGAGFLLETLTYATAQPIAFDKKDLESLNLQITEEDARESFFYNNRGDCILSIDAESYATAFSYFANGKVRQSRRFEAKINPAIFENAKLPELPKFTDNDERIYYDYDLEERPVSVHHVNEGFKTLFSYDAEGNTLCEVKAASTVLTNPAIPINGDNYRSQIYRYNHFGEKTATASALLAEIIQRTLRDETLTEEQKKTSIEHLWANFSLREQYNAEGLLIQRTESIAMPGKALEMEEKDRKQFIYYNALCKPIVQISILDDERVEIQEECFDSFGCVTKHRLYSQSERAFPKERIATLKGGLIDNALRALLNQLQNDATDIIEEKTYNKCNQLIKLIDAEGYPTCFIRNAFGEVQEEQHCVTTSKPELFIDSEFDIRGLLKLKKQRTKDKELLIVQQKHKHPLSLCTQTIDASNCQTSYLRDRLGRILEERVAVDNAVTAFKWNAFNQLVEKKDALENTTTWEHKRKARSQSCINPFGQMQETSKFNIFSETVESLNALNASTRYMHNAKGSEIQRISPSGAVHARLHNLSNQLISQKNAAGYETRYERDFAGKIRTVTKDQHFGNQAPKLVETTYKRNSLSQAFEITNAKGIVTARKFNKKAKLVEETIDPSQNGLNDQDSLNLVKKTDYYANSQKKAESLGDNSNPNQYEKAFLIDTLCRPNGEVTDPKGLNIETRSILNAAGKAVKIVHPDLSVSLQLFNMLGQKHFEIDPMGGVKEWIYDKSGRVITAITYDNPTTPPENEAPDLASPLKNPKKDTAIHYFYDAAGCERFEARVFWDYKLDEPRAVIREKKYNKACQNTEIIDYATSLSAENIEDATVESLAKETSKLANPAKDVKTRQIFDDEGRLRFSINAENYIEEIRYDSLGLEITRIAYAKKVVNAAVLSLFKPEEISQQLTKDPERDRYHYRFYDGLKRCVFEISGENQVRGYLYDAAGNCTESCLYEKTLSIPADYQQLTAALEDFQSDRKKDRVNSYFYDAGNRKARAIDPRGFEESWTYDACGHVASKTDKKGNLWRYEWDKAGRELRKIAAKVPVTAVFLNSENKLEAKAPVFTHPVTRKAWNAKSEMTAITFGEGSWDERTVEMEYNLCNKPTGTTRNAVPVDNQTPIIKGFRPESLTVIKTATGYDARQQKLWQEDEAGRRTWYLRDNFGRKVFQIGPNGATIYKDRNAQGFVQEEIRYHTAYDFANPPTLEALYAFFNDNTSKEDRRTLYQRNRLGLVKTTLKGDVYDYKVLLANPDSRTRYHAQIDYQYNAFNEITKKDTWLDSREKRSLLCWTNRCGKLVYEAETETIENGITHWRVDCYSWNSFNDAISEYKYARLLARDLSVDTTANLLQTFLNPLTSSKDRHTSYTFNENGKKTATIAHNLTRQVLDLSTQYPLLKDQFYETLCVESIDYDAHDLPIIITDAAGNKTFKFYDACQTQIAEVKPVQTNAGLTLPFAALEYRYGNIHGQLVKTQRFKQGTKPLEAIDILSANILPLPIAENEGDQTCLMLYDNRGKMAFEQDARGTLKAYSWTASGQKSREWQEVSYYEQSKVHKTKFERKKQTLDVKSYDYNLVDLPVRVSLSRNTELPVIFYTDYTLFNEEKARYTDLLDKQDITRFNTLGQAWFRMKNGIPTVLFHDFTGQEVCSIDSVTKKKLETLDFESLPSILTSSPEEVHLTRKDRDLQGRLDTLQSPGVMIDKNEQTVAFNRATAEDRLIFPKRRFQYDRFANYTKVIDELGYETDFAYNDHDKCIWERLPPVDIVTEKGETIPDFITENRYGFDLCDRPLGRSWTLANGEVKTEATLYDGLNPITHILADGSKERTNIWNALSQIYLERDARGFETFFDYEPGGFCSAMTTPLGFKYRWDWNEKNELIESANPMEGEAWHYHHDIHSNIDEIQAPMGQKTQKIYDTRHNILHQIHGDRSKLHWERDYFGQVKKFTDLSGGVTEFIRDGKNQLLERKRTGGDAFSYLEIRTAQGMNFPDVKNWGLVNQHLQFDSVNGLSMGYQDKLRGLSCEYRHNLRGERTSSRLFNTETGMVLREQYSTTNARGFETCSLDDMGTYRSGMDEEGNRRFIKLSVKDAEGSLFEKETWWTYNKPSFVSQCGALIDGAITLEPNHGFFLEYKDNLRSRETIMDVEGKLVTADLTFDEDRNLVQTDYSTGEKIVCKFDKAGRQNYREDSYPKQPTFYRTIATNHNGKIHSDEQRRPLLETNSAYIHNEARGELQQHGTRQIQWNYRPGDGYTPQTTFSGSSYSYKLKEAPVLSKIQTQYVFEGKPAGSAEITIYQGPNGELSGIMGAVSVLNKPETRTFTATPDQLVIARHDITSGIHAKIRNTRFFHDGNDNVTGSVIFESDYLADNHRFMKPNEGIMDGLHPFQVEKDKGLSRETIHGQIKDIHLYSPIRAVSYPDIALGEAGAAKVLAVLKKQPWNGKLPHQLLERYGEEIADNSGTKPYTVIFGDNYESIASKEYGDSSLSSAIALSNAHLSLTPGQVIQIPQLMSSHNSLEQSIPWQQIMAIMEGHLSPFINLIQQTPKKNHHSFFKKLMGLIAVAVAVILAVPSGGSSLAIGLGLGLKAAAAIATVLGVGTLPTIGTMIVTSVVAALIEAAEQGVLVGLGLKEFSISEAISAGFAAMGSFWMNEAGAVTEAGFNPAYLTESAIRAGSINVAEQMTLIAMHKQPALDFKSIGASIIGAAIDPAVSRYLPIKGPLAQMTMHTFSGTLVNTALNQKFDLEYLGAQLVSNLIVNAATPHLIDGLSWLDRKVFHTSSQKIAVKHPQNKRVLKKRRIATKEDVNRSPTSIQNSMENDPFMKRLGFKDLQDDYNAFVSALNSGNEGSYTGYDISNWIKDYVDNLTSYNISNWIEDYVDNLAFGSGEDAVQSTMGKSSHEYDIFDYSRAFNRGFERGRDGVVNVFLHPLDTLKGMGNLISAGANALTDLATDSFDPDAHQRNIMREAAILQAVSNLKEADSLARVELLAELTSGAILGSAFGGGMVSAVGRTASLTSKVAVKLSKSRYALFGEQGLNIDVQRVNIRNRVLENIAENKTAMASSNFLILTAKENQILSGYNADTWLMVDIKKGDIVFGGLPGQSAYYTTEKTVINSEYLREKLFQSLQVKPHPIFGFRPKIGLYEVLRDLKVPGGTVNANPHLGIGGAEQLLIKNFETSIKLKQTIELGEDYGFVSAHRPSY